MGDDDHPGAEQFQGEPGALRGARSLSHPRNFGLSDLAGRVFVR